MSRFWFFFFGSQFYTKWDSLVYYIFLLLFFFAGWITQLGNCSTELCDLKLLLRRKVTPKNCWKDSFKFGFGFLKFFLKVLSFKVQSLSFSLRSITSNRPWAAWRRESPKGVRVQGFFSKPSNRAWSWKSAFLPHSLFHFKRGVLEYRAN